MTRPAVRPSGVESLLRLTPVVAAHLAEALRFYRRSWRENGMAVPWELERLQADCARAAMSGLDETDLDHLTRVNEAAVVPVKLLTYAQVARSLGCSERTVRRLVERGDLVGVRFGGAARVRPADLDAFVDSLADGVA